MGITPWVVDIYTDVENSKSGRTRRTFLSIGRQLSVFLVTLTFMAFLKNPLFTLQLLEIAATKVIKHKGHLKGSATSALNLLKVKMSIFP
jgi:hypothetical protein